MNFLKQYTKENISKDGIKVITKKTGKTLNTVIIEETQEILEKYNYELPNISKTNLPKLHAVLVKKSGAVLSEGAFEAYATLQVDYQ